MNENSSRVSPCGNFRVADAVSPSFSAIDGRSASYQGRSECCRTLSTEEEFSNMPVSVSTRTINFASLAADNTNETGEHYYRRIGSSQGTARKVMYRINNENDLEEDFPHINGKREFKYRSENIAVSDNIDLIQTDTEKLHIVTLSTDNTGPIENWEYTARLHGYNYTILGRGEKWGGWSWRTSKYIEKVKELPYNSLVVLCDGNDIFFAREPEILISAYRSYNTDLLFGGEPTCCTGKYGATSGLIGMHNRDNAIRDIYSRKPPTRWCFPNAGCIMGTKKRILQVLKDVQYQPDDQAGYLEKYLSDASYLTIDYYSRMVGNVNAFSHLYCVDCGLFDSPQKYEKQFWRQVNDRSLSSHMLYRNVQTGEIPAILHFPGKNILLYNYFGYHMYPDNFITSKAKEKMLSPVSQSTKILSSIAQLWR